MILLNWKVVCLCASLPYCYQLCFDLIQILRNEKEKYIMFVIGLNKV